MVVGVMGRINRIRLSVRLFVRSCVRPFVNSFVSPFVRSFIRLFVRSFARPFARSFVRLVVLENATKMQRKCVCKNANAGPVFNGRRGHGQLI